MASRLTIRTVVSGSEFFKELDDMFSNVVVGVVGLPGGRDAVALAKQLAAPEVRFTLAYI